MPITRRSAMTLPSLLAAPALAQPTRPIRMLMGFPPGGPTDFVGRLTANGLQDQIGQTIVFENRPGANSVLAAEAVARAAADGHTLLFASNSLAMNASAYARLPYDPTTSFAPIAMVATSPNVLWCGTSQPWHSLDQLVAAAKAQPGTLGYASTGNGGNGHFGGETLRQALGIDISHIPYRGTAPALLDVIAGRVPLMMQTMVGAIGPYRENQLRPLVVFGPNRAPELPDVPTLKELGHEVPDSGVWFGVLAPAGTPPPFVMRVSHALQAMLEKPESRAQLASQASVPAYLGPDDFAARIRTDVTNWADVARRAGIRPE
ncbi:Bug family tripartite tricarboxylate transporter substrate binding protein [Roseococcus sp. YIM B11640]|uniref:Bug family tripartite tricarboxylate transporter substrate binding protein n=1 Tax=Roseococcus sp. YIM B11640 TaxID=3133973 RepID=UPI003C7CA95E